MLHKVWSKNSNARSTSGHQITLQAGLTQSKAYLGGSYGKQNFKKFMGNSFDICLLNFYFLLRHNGCQAIKWKR